MKWVIKFSIKKDKQVIRYQRKVGSLPELVTAFDEIFHNRKEEDVLEVYITRR